MGLPSNETCWIRHCNYSTACQMTLFDFVYVKLILKCQIIDAQYYLISLFMSLNAPLTSAIYCINLVECYLSLSLSLSLSVQITYRLRSDDSVSVFVPSEINGTVTYILHSSIVYVVQVPLYCVCNFFIHPQDS